MPKQRFGGTGNHRGMCTALHRVCRTQSETSVRKTPPPVPRSGRVGGEIYLGTTMFGVIYRSHGVSMQCPAVESCRKELSLVAVESEFPEYSHVQTREINLPVDLLFYIFMYRLARVCLMDVTETYVVTESGDDAESHLHHLSPPTKYASAVMHPDILWSVSLLTPMVIRYHMLRLTDCSLSHVYPCQVDFPRECLAVCLPGIGTHAAPAGSGISSVRLNNSLSMLQKLFFISGVIFLRTDDTVSSSLTGNCVKLIFYIFIFLLIRLAAVLCSACWQDLALAS